MCMYKCLVVFPSTSCSEFLSVSLPTHFSLSLSLIAHVQIVVLQIVVCILSIVHGLVTVTCYSIMQCVCLLCMCHSVCVCVFVCV